MKVTVVFLPLPHGKDAFMDVVIRRNILTKEDEYNITEYLSSPEHAQVDIPRMPRMFVKISQHNSGKWWVGKVQPD